MPVNVANFQNYSMELKNKATDRDGEKNCVWIVLEPFFRMRCAKYAWYLLWEISILVRGFRGKNVVSSFLAKPKLMIEDTSYEFLNVVDTRNIEIGDEFFICYRYNSVFKEYGMLGSIFLLFCVHYVYWPYLLLTINYSVRLSPERGTESLSRFSTLLFGFTWKT